MSVGNRNHVCFKCRKTARRLHHAQAPRCPKCRSSMVVLDQSWEVPKKRDNRGWKDLFEMEQRTKYKS